MKWLYEILGYLTCRGSKRIICLGKSVKWVFDDQMDGLWHRVLSLSNLFSLLPEYTVRLDFSVSLAIRCCSKTEFQRMEGMQLPGLVHKNFPHVILLLLPHLLAGCWCQNGLGSQMLKVRKALSAWVFLLAAYGRALHSLSQTHWPEYWSVRWVRN